MHTYVYAYKAFSHTHTHRCALICLIKLHSDRAFNHSQFSNHSLAHSRAKQTNVNTDAVLHKCEWQYVCVCTLASSGTTQTNTQEHTYTHKHAHTHLTYSSIYIELTLHAQATSLSTLASALSYLALAASANRAFNLFVLVMPSCRMRHCCPRRRCMVIKNIKCSILFRSNKNNSLAKTLINVFNKQE